MAQLTGDVEDFVCVEAVDDAALNSTLKCVNSHAIPVIIKVLQYVHSRVLVDNVQFYTGLELGRNLGQLWDGLGGC